MRISARRASLAIFAAALFALLPGPASLGADNALCFHDDGPLDWDGLPAAGSSGDAAAPLEPVGRIDLPGFAFLPHGSPARPLSPRAPPR